ncbi:MAG: hypothetical protein DRG37_08175 [Deltaproteobacteria bacterium]|nr:MAG: hypothetical protein DRG37_08175 [Deltaproteobacteria bacterium]
MAKTRKEKIEFPKLPVIKDLAPKKRGLVTTKLQVFETLDPMGPEMHWMKEFVNEEDPWKDFRLIEKIQIDQHITYRHSLGKYSKFFIELENKRFFATKCPKCGQVWPIPRPVCPNDLTICKWVELPGTGTLVSHSISRFIPSFMRDRVDIPYVLAMVRMDGAPKTLFTHMLKNYGKEEDIYDGMRVKVAYSDKPVPHPLLLMWFEPA